MTLSGAGAQTLPTDVQPTCTVSQPIFKSWFETGTPSLNGVVQPADSVGFPNPPQNCAFYLWSEQMFLWLTSPAPKSYGGGSHIFDSPTFFDASAPDSNGDRTFIRHEPGMIRHFNLRIAKTGPNRLPVVMDKKGRMFEILPPNPAPSGKLQMLNQLNKPVEIDRVTVEKGKPLFLDKNGKTVAKPKAIVPPQLALKKALVVQKFVVGATQIFVDPAGNVLDVEQGQAGGGDVLQAQNGSLVYYVSMVNDVYAYFLTGTKGGGITPKPNSFPTTAADLKKITDFAATRGVTFPDAKALAIEVKSSWVEATSLSNPADYIIMDAIVPTYDTSNPILWTPKPGGDRQVKLALVGMHVVGSTAGHPEMIWATFEHFGNTPNAAYQYNATTGPNPKTVAQSTVGPWLFAANNSGGPFNQSHMAFVNPNIAATAAPTNSGTPPPFTVSPSDTMRMKAFGGGFDFKPNPLDASTAASNTEVISINNSVLGPLKTLGSDVRTNYYMVGSTWTIGGAAPTSPFKSGAGNEVGTSQLANSTMETYMQGPSNLWGGTNCFSCHKTNTVQVSHIFCDPGTSTPTNCANGLQPLPP
jgi:hypothetical protein